MKERYPLPWQWLGCFPECIPLAQPQEDRAEREDRRENDDSAYQ